MLRLRDSGFALCAPRNDAHLLFLILRSARLRASKDDLVISHGPSRHCEERKRRSNQFVRRTKAMRWFAWLAMTVQAPIAIFGSASAFAFISFSARRYSTG